MVTKEEHDREILLDEMEQRRFYNTHDVRKSMELYEQEIEFEVKKESSQDFFDELNEEFAFTLDPCATPENAKCAKFYTIEDDGLSKSWAGERVFLNPPYGKGAQNWIAKAYFESLYTEVIVGLLPARTDTKWFHDYVYGKAEVRFRKGRLKFVGPDGKTGTATFPSIIVIWRPPSRASRPKRTLGYLDEHNSVGGGE